MKAYPPGDVIDRCTRGEKEEENPCANFIVDTDVPQSIRTPEQGGRTVQSRLRRSRRSVMAEAGLESKINGVEIE